MNDDKILLDHGSGGKISHDLVAHTLLPLFDNAVLSQLNDGATLSIGGANIAFSTDSFVVDPLFFPGGDIGDLAVNGTVNDLAMCGATPLYLSVGLIIEEGFSMADLTRILQSMKKASTAAGVLVVTGDTKVVPKGAADKIFINTSGIGQLLDYGRLSADGAMPGDLIILSGTMADHGITILNQREQLSFTSDVVSDTAPLNGLVSAMFSATADIHVLRDPTRGGVGTALNEIAEKSHVGIKLYEANLPVRDDVAGMCELLGLDPLYVANEGKLLAFVAPDAAPRILEIMRADCVGKNACIIGEVVSDHPDLVYMATRIGGSRIVQMLAGDQLPRIC